MHKLPTIELTEFLHFLFDFLEIKKIQYAVARNYEELDCGNPGRDIDILLEEKNINPVISFISRLGITITGFVQREYVTSIFCAGICWNNHLSLGLDLVHKLNYKGAPYLDLLDVLKRKRLYPGRGLTFWIPDAIDEDLILLMEGLIVGGSIRDAYWKKIIRRMDSAITAVKRLEPSLGTAKAKKLLDLIHKKDLKDVMTERSSLVYTLISRAFIKHPFYTSKQTIVHIARELSIRLFKRHLFTIAFLGPDGAGKSTLISQIALKLNGIAGKINIRHLKPVYIFKKRTTSRGVVTEPHAKPLRGWAMSNLKIILWWFELWFDRITKFPKTMTLDIFDRCMWDILIDPKRYRFNGSRTLLSGLLKLSPKIDIIAVVVSSPDTIQLRKAEVPLFETARQVSGYNNLAKDNNFLLLKNDGQIDAVAQPGIHRITKVMSQRISHFFQV
ncbi:MAG: hypothetical protein HN597_10025 [Desulfobacula sp.]|uniref:hypothetical protein n=1 Tax=Desulfobacula sp. TaxID=2593537 RepID=UPI0039B86865|nr:hypothetical protein [Desulfobacula sp.]